MKTDRELLELAAKAAGMHTGGWALDTSKGMRLQDGEDEFLAFWNPLTDDGDCARLEAVLEIELQWHDDGVQAGKRGNPIGVFCFYAEHCGDKNAARRRASTEYAAAIGEGM